MYNMSKTKYRVIQTVETEYVVQEWKPVSFDCDWVDVKDGTFLTLEGAKGYIDDLINKAQYPKVVYEKEA